MPCIEKIRTNRYFDDMCTVKRNWLSIDPCRTSHVVLAAGDDELASVRFAMRWLLYNINATSRFNISGITISPLPLNIASWKMICLNDGCETRNKPPQTSIWANVMDNVVVHAFCINAGKTSADEILIVFTQMMFSIFAGETSINCISVRNLVRTSATRK